MGGNQKVKTILVYLKMYSAKNYYDDHMVEDGNGRAFSTHRED
jgi:hypothetical protein